MNNEKDSKIQIGDRVRVEYEGEVVSQVIPEDLFLVRAEGIGELLWSPKQLTLIEQ